MVDCCGRGGAQISLIPVVLGGIKIPYRRRKSRIAVNRSNIPVGRPFLPFFSVWRRFFCRFWLFSGRNRPFTAFFSCRVSPFEMICPGFILVLACGCGVPGNRPRRGGGASVTAWAFAAAGAAVAAAPACFRRSFPYVRLLQSFSWSQSVFGPSPRLLS